MKKSFKKAGAAVLSMSMLLAMGAVSMPVYAADPPAVNNWPGQVEVVIDDASTWASADKNDPTNQKFSYLENVTNATVRMYQVATHGPNGWEWNEPFKTQLLNKKYLDETTGLASADSLDDFQKLLAEDATSHKFTVSSDDLMQLASALEKIARDQNATELTSGSMPVTGGNGHLFLPTDTELNLTENQTGYYLLTTTTSDAGVVLQPVLVSLKDRNDGGNPVEVALKGYNIDVQKTIEEVKDTDTGVSLGGSVIGATDKDTAIVAKDDTITYKIVTELPKYDVNLSADDIKDFCIIDTPDTGIKVTTGDAPNFTVPGLEVYAGSTKLTQKVGANAGDYSVTATATGFTITFEADEFHTKNNTTGKKMEGETITVTFNATIDENLNRGNNALATATDLTKAQITAQATAANTQKTNSESYTTTLAAFNDTANALQTTLGHTPTDLEKVEAQLALAADATKTYATLTAENLAAQETAAKALQDANTAYTAAVAAITDGSDDAQTLIDILNEGVEEASQISVLTPVLKAQIALALAQLQSEGKVGNDNKADITYGNQYATGQGEGSDTDKATVYSVDLDLTKIAEKVKLTRDTDGDYGNDAKKEEWYDDGTEVTKISGAVLELFKKDDHTATAESPKVADQTLGKAVSVNGKMFLLDEGSTTKPADVTTIVYSEERVKTPATETTPAVMETVYYTATNKPAWIELTKGNYVLKELQAPAGYYEFADIEFAVGAEQASATDTNSAYTGVFNATTASTAIKSEDGTASTIVFNGFTGQLQANAIDPLADKLPATGGIGTVLFTAGGISIVLIAGALFVMYMKKRNGEEEE